MKADLILYNGKIHPGDHTAVAILDGRFVAVGKDADILNNYSGTAGRS